MAVYWGGVSDGREGRGGGGWGGRSSHRHDSKLVRKEEIGGVNVV